MAETYNIYDYLALSPLLVARLSIGLRDDSRVKMKLMNRKITIDQEILLSIFDTLNLTAWLQTDDGRKGMNRPESVVAKLKGENTRKGFSSADEMEEAKKRIIEKARKESIQ